MNKLTGTGCFINAVLLVLLTSSQLAVYGQDSNEVQPAPITPNIGPDLTLEESVAAEQNLKQGRALERKFGECSGTTYCERFGMYGVKSHTTKRDGKVLSIVTGVVVGPAKYKRYKSIKVCVEINSKSKGKIKRFAELKIGNGAPPFQDKVLPQGAVSYTNFKWTLPSDIDLDSLNITEASAQ